MNDFTGGIVARQEQLVWVISDKEADILTRNPLPLALLPPRNIYRDHAIEAIERAGRRWQVACVSESVAGLQAAVFAGMAVTMLCKCAVARLRRQIMNNGFRPGGRAYGYVRVSTRAQAEDGESLGVQERMLAGFAMMHGRELGQVFVERAVSGGSPFAKRPAAAEALAAMERGDTLIIVKLDRGFRDAGDMLDTIRLFRERGMDLISIDLGGSIVEGGVAGLIATILGAVAQFERERIKERTADTKADQKTRGMHLGGPRPFGWAIEQREAGAFLIEDPAEQAAIARIRAMREQGMSLRKIAAAVHADGHRLSHVGVADILKGETGRRRSETDADH